MIQYVIFLNAENGTGDTETLASFIKQRRVHEAGNDLEFETEIKQINT